MERDEARYQGLGQPLADRPFAEIDTTTSSELPFGAHLQHAEQAHARALADGLGRTGLAGYGDPFSWHNRLLSGAD